MTTDGPDEIARCLKCTKNSCTNCLASVPQRLENKKVRPIDIFDPATGELVAHYPTISKACRVHKVSSCSIDKHCNTGKPYKGFIWKDHIKEGDNTLCTTSHKSNNG